jgi:hypothetical protein
VPNAITNPNQIFSILTANTNSFLGNNTNTLVPSVAQQAINSLISITAMTGSAPVTSAAQTSYTTMLPSLTGVLSFIDPNIPTPNISTSPDPSIALLQSFLGGQQTTANFAAIFRQLLQGQGYNNFNDVPLRPRNTPVTGELGSYAIDIGYKF